MLRGGAPVESDERNGYYDSTVPDLAALIEHVQQSIESAIASEVFSGNEDLAAAIRRYPRNFSIGHAAWFDCSFLGERIAIPIADTFFSRMLIILTEEVGMPAPPYKYGRASVSKFNAH
jgi:hypothetical protein